MTRTQTEVARGYGRFHCRYAAQGRTVSRAPIRSVVAAAAVALTACSAATSAAPSSPTASPRRSSATVAPPPGSRSCANPLMPVRDQISWSYLIHSNVASDTAYTDTITKVGSGGFTVSSAFSDLTKDVQWSCTTQGLVALQFGGGDSASLSTSGSNASFKTTNVTGVTIPIDPKPGDTWSQSFDIAGTQSVGGATAKTSGTVALDFAAKDVEHVTVPAGAYDALAVEQQVKFSLTVQVAGVSQDVHLSFSGTTWYAPGVGMIKSVSSGTLSQGGGTIESTIELTKTSAS